MVINGKGKQALHLSLADITRFVTFIPQLKVKKYFLNEWAVALRKSITENRHPESTVFHHCLFKTHKKGHSGATL